jgi:hypothetical protein
MRRASLLPAMSTPSTQDPLNRALDEALAGRIAPLYALLERGSRLPGPAANDALAEAFALACRARHPKADALAFTMARLSADEAPGGGPREFLPVCGLLALAVRAASEAALRPAVLAELHAHADDLRFRVRDAVIAGLVRIGATAGDALVPELQPWTDGYFHAAAAVTALSREAWLGQLQDSAAVVQRLDEAWETAVDAPRAAARYPGRKALVDALARTPVPLAVRFGPPVFDVLARWGRAKDPEMRALVLAILGDKRLVTRFAGDVQRVRAALDETAPPVRNPDHDFGTSRDRSGARRRRERR